ncbi:MAG TPA: class IV adenylate cyclase [Pyrinomonadaceae bacterium]|nr:class IV adenylate cyclase [Pyrinomonadaceae bacterium]
MTTPWKPTKEQLLAATSKTVPDVIAPGLRVLFCGINPGLYTAAVGHHFARPGNRFWPALHAGGFTDRVLSPFDERELLQSGYGITNVVMRTTATADLLTKEETVAGGKILGVDAAVFRAGGDARSYRDADAAVLADRIVVVHWIWQRAFDHVVCVARVSRWDVDVRQTGVDSRGVALGATGLVFMIEVEKKYRLTSQQRDDVLQRLREVGAEFRGDELEENMIYGGLKRENSVLRLRRVRDRATLTYKERLPESAAIKQYIEEETAVDDADAMDAILKTLGFAPALVYEKRRQTWVFRETEIVIDELSFGLFMEIEGDEGQISVVEQALGIEGLPAEHATYPQLTNELGQRVGDVIEARLRRNLSNF